MTRMRPGLALALLLVPVGAGAKPAAPPPAPIATGALGPACAGEAARYENGKGFTLFAIRAGEVRIDNPLRPLTPDLTHVLEVVVGGKRASAFGPDYASLRRGGPPGAMQAALGAPIRWEPSMPPLPETIGIVAEDGTLLAALSFRACEAAPAVAPEPPPKVAKKGKDAGGNSAASGGPGRAKASKPTPKVPPGFSMPAGAIPE